MDCPAPARSESVPHLQVCGRFGQDAPKTCPAASRSILNSPSVILFGCGAAALCGGRVPKKLLGNVPFNKACIRKGNGHDSARLSGALLIIDSSAWLSGGIGIMGLKQQTGRLPDRSGVKGVSSQLPCRGRFVARCGKGSAIATRCPVPAEHSGEQFGRGREAKRFGRRYTHDDHSAKAVLFGLTPVVQLPGGKRAGDPAQGELCFADGVNLTSGRSGNPHPRPLGARVALGETPLGTSPQAPETGNVMVSSGGGEAAH